MCETLKKLKIALGGKVQQQDLIFSINFISIFVTKFVN
jgi:hypothetical protein